MSNTYKDLQNSHPCFGGHKNNTGRIPLIPQHELKDYAAPTCPQIDEARIKASKYIDVFRHCQHCRADAVGVPGKSEFGDQIYQRRLNVKETFSHG